MAKHKFTYYMHDNEGGEYLLRRMAEQIPSLSKYDLTDYDSIDEFGQLVGRPFYEITLECEFDDVTGAVEIISAKA